MLAALLVAAGFSAASAAPARSLDQRVSLLEARQLLESQSLWSLQAALHPEALKAVADVELHVAQDRERDEALRAMTERVFLLERRLQALELAVGDRMILEGQLRMAPQRGEIGEPLILPRSRAPQAKAPAKPAAKKARPSGRALASN
jgi:hypothetical protein